MDIRSHLDKSIKDFIDAQALRAARSIWDLVKIEPDQVVLGLMIAKNEWGDNFSNVEDFDDRIVVAATEYIEPLTKLAMVSLAIMGKARISDGKVQYDLPDDTPEVFAEACREARNEMIERN